MRKFFVIVPLLSGSLCTAQITVTDEHLWSVGDLLILHHDTMPDPSWYLSAASADPQMWDYTNSFTVHYTDTTVYVDPATLSGHELFPDATAGFQQPDALLQVNQFYEVGPSGMALIGSHGVIAGFATIDSWNDGFFLHPTPLTYGSVLVNPIRMDGIMVMEPNLMQPAGRTITYMSQTFQVDAYGTLKTPSFPDGVEVIRMSWSLSGLRTDSTFTDPTGTGNGPWEFTEVDTVTLVPEIRGVEFLQAGTPMVVATLVFDPITLQVTEASYSDPTLGATSVQPSIAGPAELQLFPVPATEFVQVVVPNDQGRTISITDVTGRTVLRYPIVQRGLQTVSLGSLPAGPYYLSVLDGNQLPLATSKIVHVDP